MIVRQFLDISFVVIIHIALYYKFWVVEIIVLNLSLAWISSHNFSFQIVLCLIANMLQITVICQLPLGHDLFPLKLVRTLSA
jgi:hypothetical protein